MVLETICDLVEDKSLRGIETARCLNCGNFEDPRIRTNRVISGMSGQVDLDTVGNRKRALLSHARRSEPHKRTVLSRRVPAVGHLGFLLRLL